LLIPEPGDPRHAHELRSGLPDQPKGWQIGFRFESGAAYNTLRYAQATG